MWINGIFDLDTELFYIIYWLTFPPLLSMKNQSVIYHATNFYHIIVKENLLKQDYLPTWRA